MPNPPPGNGYQHRLHGWIPVLPLISYIFSVAPAFVIFAALLTVIPQSAAPIRIALHILFFVLARDAMTPQGFWQIGQGSLRFTASPMLLLVLSALSLGLAFGVYFAESASRANIIWKGKNFIASAAMGIAGATIISVTAATLKQGLNLPDQPAPPSHLLPVLLIFALAGNAYEELLFRGLLQGELCKHLSAPKAALTSGLFFCLCHAFLATTVTGIGLPIYVFTLIEGIVAGMVCIRGGLLAATIAHGGAIFVLGAGFYG